MKITKEILKRIVKEEIEASINEWSWDKFKSDIGIGPKYDPHAEEREADAAKEEAGRESKAESAELLKQQMAKAKDKAQGMCRSAASNLKYFNAFYHQPCVDAIVDRIEEKLPGKAGATLVEWIAKETDRWSYTLKEDRMADAFFLACQNSIIYAEKQGVELSQDGASELLKRAYAIKYASAIPSKCAGK